MDSLLCKWYFRKKNQVKIFYLWIKIPISYYSKICLNLLDLIKRKCHGGYCNRLELNSRPCRSYWGSIICNATTLQETPSKIGESVEAEDKSLGTFISKLWFWPSILEGHLSEWNVEGSEGLSALCRQERRDPIKENPSLRAWWSLKIKKTSCICCWVFEYMNFL